MRYRKVVLSEVDGPLRLPTTSDLERLALGLDEATIMGSIDAFTGEDSITLLINAHVESDTFGEFEKGGCLVDLIGVIAMAAYISGTLPKQLCSDNGHVQVRLNPPRAKVKYPEKEFKPKVNGHRVRPSAISYSPQAVFAE